MPKNKQRPATAPKRLNKFESAQLYIKTEYLSHYCRTLHILKNERQDHEQALVEVKRKAAAFDVGYIALKAEIAQIKGEKPDTRTYFEESTGRK